MKTFLPYLSLSFLTVPLLFADAPVNESFSLSEGRQAGDLIGEDSAWHVVPPAGAIITDLDSMVAGQSLLLQPGVPVTEAARDLPMDGDPLYLELWIRPAASEALEATSLEAEGAQLAFVREGPLGAVTAGVGEARALPQRFGLVDDGLFNRWVHIVLKIRRSESDWSLALDGEVVLTNLPSSPDTFPGEVVFHGHQTSPVHIDGLRIGSTAPTGFDWQGEPVSDGDPSSEPDEPDSESTFLAETNAGASEKNHTAGEVPQTGDTDSGAVATVYVDNTTGDDSFDGRTASADGGGGGPVASLAAALARVENGGTIVIHEGDVYVGNLGNLGGRNVRLQTVGNVRVRSSGDS